MKDNGGQVVATNETEAKANAEASFENNNSGTGSVPAPDKEENANMKKTDTSKQPHDEGKKPERAEIEIDLIRFEDGTYPRDHIDENAVHEYSEAMKKKVRFPEIEVYRSGGGTFWLSDGRHRLEAGKMAGMTRVWALVYEGGQRDAILHSLDANLGHGVRRTNADKRKAVMIVLQDPEWRDWNDSKIARRCHVSPPSVKDVKDELAGTADHGKELDDGNSSIVERNGKRFLQKRRAAAKPLPAHLEAIHCMRVQAHAACAGLIGIDPELGKRFKEMDAELHEIVGRITGAKETLQNLPVPLNVYHRKLESGIKASPEFEKKDLATHTLNVGLGCGHQCTYCSSPSLRCRLPAYGEIRLSAYSRGFAVIDPDTGARVLKGMPKLKADDTVMLSACDDAWSPEARAHGVGRKSLEALLKNTPAKIRVLTKSAAVAEDFDVVKGFEERVMLGLSVGIPGSREDVAAAVEPNASPVRDRLDALKTAHDQGFKTYGMLCPCLPGIADTEAALTEMFTAVKSCGASKIYLEPVNARGRGLINTAEALRIAGFKDEAEAVDAIRNEKAWSKYAADLAETAAKVAESLDVRERLHVLMYTSELVPSDLVRVKALGGCVTLLGKDVEAGTEEPAADAAGRSDAA